MPSINAFITGVPDSTTRSMLKMGEADLGY